MLFGAITLLWGTLSIFMFNFEDILDMSKVVDLYDILSESGIDLVETEEEGNSLAKDKAIKEKDKKVYPPKKRLDLEHPNVMHVFQSKYFYARFSVDIYPSHWKNIAIDIRNLKKKTLTSAP